MSIAIIKYNAGNVLSVQNAFKRLNVETIITDDKRTILSADKIIFPGVGEAGTAMKHLHDLGLDIYIQRLQQPILGICLGMQLMCAHSEESDTEGLNIFNGIDVKRFVPEKTSQKVPHMGWNNIYDLKGKLFDEQMEKEFAYFVHSYYVPLNEYTIATTNYILPFSAAMNKDNFYATQFHPEKSGGVGEEILRNFLELR